MIVQYNCKFCGKPGSVEIEDNDATMFCIEKWGKILCCNRCGEFKVSLRKLNDAIFRLCRTLDVCRLTPDSEKRRLVESSIREQLTQVTKRYSSVVCNHYRVTNVWEPEFAQMIFEKPDKASVALGVYIRGVARVVRHAP